MYQSSIFVEEYDRFPTIMGSRERKSYALDTSPADLGVSTREEVVRALTQGYYLWQLPVTGAREARRLARGYAIGLIQSFSQVSPIEQPLVTPLPFRRRGE